LHEKKRQDAFVGLGRRLNQVLVRRARVAFFHSTLKCTREDLEGGLLGLNNTMKDDFMDSRMPEVISELPDPPRSFARTAVFGIIAGLSILSNRKSEWEILLI
jgi:hypothetical protein